MGKPPVQILGLFGFWIWVPKQVRLRLSRRQTVTFLSLSSLFHLPVSFTGHEAVFGGPPIACSRLASRWQLTDRQISGACMRDELLNGEIFDTLLEAQVLVERWRKHYNQVRPHSALGYRPPAPEAILPPPVALTPGYAQN